MQSLFYEKQDKLPYLTHCNVVNRYLLDYKIYVLWTGNYENVYEDHFPLPTYYYK